MIVKPTGQLTHSVLGLREIRAASKPEFNLQKEKANTSGKKDWQCKRELEAAVLQEANSGPQVTFEQPMCCKGQGNTQKSPYANTHPARELADIPPHPPHDVTAPRKIILAPCRTLLYRLVTCWRKLKIKDIYFERVFILKIKNI